MANKTANVRDFVGNFVGSHFRLADNWFNFVAVEYKPINYLEIGAFYGANIISVAKSYAAHPESRLYCIDIWQDYNDYNEYEGQQDEIFKNFQLNIDNNKLQDKIVLFKNFSHKIIPTLEDDFFDIIYIDGNNRSDYVLEDAILSFRKLKIGGVMIFDDYGLNDTTTGIDAFVSAFCKRIDVIIIAHYMQTFIRKLN